MSIHVKSTIHDEPAFAKGQNVYAKRVLVIDEGDEQSTKTYKLSLGISLDSSYPFQTRIISSVWTDAGWTTVMSYRHDSFGDLPSSYTYNRDKAQFDQTIEAIYDKMVSDAVKVLLD